MHRPFAFTIEHHDLNSRARAGVFHTPHGPVPTPVFMPVGTYGAVKGLTPDRLRELGSTILLTNTYHLALRPGAEVVARLGGLHRFMAWDGPILTDSGGYQVYSLAAMCRPDDDGVTFQSHLDGSWVRLDAASAIRIQEQLGADVIMAFDECVRLPAERPALERAVERTIRWAARCKDSQTRPDQALFGIVQGGLDLELRCRCLDAVAAMEFPGYAVGGLSVGEAPDEMARFLDSFVHRMPADRPRYLMGVGRPIDLIRAAAAGIDMFDCVMPTRHGRNAYAFVRGGYLRMRNARHRTDERPLDDGCDCYTCKCFSRGYLRHLFLAGEMLGPLLVSLHNIAYYHRWMRQIRSAIAAGRFGELLSQTEAAEAAEGEAPECKNS